MNRERLKVYAKLYDLYREKQLYVALEELSELQKEICKSLRGKADLDALKEEIADVVIMLEQLLFFFDIKEKQILEKMNEKIERTKQRMFPNNERNL